MTETQRRLIVLPTDPVRIEFLQQKLEECKRIAAVARKFEKTIDWMTFQCRVVLLERLLRDRQVDVNALRDELARSQADFFNLYLFEDAYETVLIHCGL